MKDKRNYDRAIKYIDKRIKEIKKELKKGERNTLITGNNIYYKGLLNRKKITYETCRDLIVMKFGEEDEKTY